MHLATPSNARVLIDHQLSATTVARPDELPERDRGVEHLNVVIAVPVECPTNPSFANSGWGVGPTRIAATGR